MIIKKFFSVLWAFPGLSFANGLNFFAKFWTCKFFTILEQAKVLTGRIMITMDKKQCRYRFLIYFPTGILLVNRNFVVGRRVWNFKEIKARQTQQLIILLLLVLMLLVLMLLVLLRLSLNKWIKIKTDREMSWIDKIKKKDMLNIGHTLFSFGPL